MAKRPRKPTGDLGAIVVGGKHPIPTYVPLQMPGTKEELESWILERARKAASQSGASFLPSGAEPERNPENHFDYTIRTESNEEEYLDLMEIVLGERGHESSPRAYDAQKAADRVWARISKKSGKYGASRSTIHLLLYATDWRNGLVGPVSDWVACYLARREHVFKTVSYFDPDIELGKLVRLYPLSADDVEVKCRHEKSKTRKWISFGNLQEARWGQTLPDVQPEKPERDSDQ